MAHSLRFSWLRWTLSLPLPDFYLLLLIALINLESLDRDRCNCQEQCHRNPHVVIYSACISAVVTYSAYISVNRDYADRSRLSSPIRSLARSSSVKEFARNETNVAGEKGKRRGAYYFSHLLLPFREASQIFPVSLLPAQRFPACDMAGLLILIIDRGIIKVALARGRFQLRISVSLGTIGPVGR